MQMEKNTVVEFHYTLKEGESVIETSRNSDAIMLLVGHQNMLAGVEGALLGKQAGDEVSVTLAPNDAYGQRKNDAMQRIPLKHLVGNKKWRPGMIATVQTDDGQRQVTVTKVGKFNADCDLNHPLAGKTLTFELNVVSVRAATATEISHGHVHGKGGVDH